MPLINARFPIFGKRAFILFNSSVDYFDFLA